MNQCPCGSDRSFATCCGPILDGQPAATPEALMRSRYSAYVLGDLGYLEHSLAPEAKRDFDPAATEQWAKSVEWQGLSILATSDAGGDPDWGGVEFVARFRQGKTDQAHHERSRFRRLDGHWRYVDGAMIRTPMVRAGVKVGRNDPCPCGSGKKFKQCCA